MGGFYFCKQNALCAALIGAGYVFMARTCIYPFKQKTPQNAKFRGCGRFGNQGKRKTATMGG